MSLTRLSSGRIRAQIYHQGKNINVSEVLGLPKGTTWPDRRSAKIAREQARQALASKTQTGVTVQEFWERWTSDPLFARPKESTNLHNAERTKHFADRFAGRELTSINDQDVAQWILEHRGTVPALRAMFNDARSLKAGRLISENPFAELGLESSKGRAEQQPPTVEQAWKLIEAAKEVSCPSFAGWLQCAMWTGMRSAELDALRWEDVDLEGGWLTVRQQFNTKTRTFTPPKNGRTRAVPLHRESFEAIDSQPRIKEFVFLSLTNEHWRHSSRAYHWKSVRARAGWDQSLYLATRHFAGWMMYDQLLMPAEDVAIALGHEDGGDLVRRTYGHRDKRAALVRVKAAFEAARGENVRPLRSVG